MKIKFAIFSILFLISCNNNSIENSNVLTSSNQKIFFEVHHINAAWGYQEHGFLIDSLGYVRTFDLSTSHEHWNYPDSQSILKNSEMIANLMLCNSIVKQLPKDSLAFFISKIIAASIGTISKPTMAMADYGSTEYSAYVFNKKTDKYNKITLKIYGDWMVDNNSAEANEIYQWLSRINYRNIY